MAHFFKKTVENLINALVSTFVDYPASTEILAI